GHANDVVLEGFGNGTAPWASAAAPPSPTAPPQLISFAPTIGPTGSVVVIDGSNLLGTTGVGFNGKPAVFVVITSTELIATVPPDVTSGHITITNPNGPATSAGTFSTAVVSPAAPSNAVAVAGNGTATVSFNPPAFDGGSPILSYTVTSSPGGGTVTGAGSPI